MKLMNLNNSITEEKESKKRLNYISSRIKNLEKDIFEIKNKESKTSMKYQKKLPENKYINTINESKLKSKFKYTNSSKDFNKTSSIINENKSNSSLSKEKQKQFQKRFFKRMNNYNDIIHEKKNILLNINSQLNKKFQRNNFYGKNILYNMKIKSSSDNRKIRNFFSFDETYDKSNEIKNINYNINLNNISHDDNDYNNIDNKNGVSLYKKNNMEKLEYEFEIRRLKREYEMLQKENIKIKENIENVKIKNTNLENNIFKNEDQQKILNNLLLLNKQYILYGSPNGIENEFSNKNGNDNYSIDNLILNIMDIKYYYENNLLINEFIEGINKILATVPLSNNGNNDDNNLIKKINELIDIKNNLDNNNNKYKYFLEKNNNYYFYYKNLLNNLNLNNFTELEDFIKNLYIKNLKDNDHMQKIQNTLMSESSPGHKNKDKKSHYNSSNLITNNISKNIYNINNYTKLQNYLSIKNTDSRLNQKNINNFIDNKRRKDLEQYLSRTEKLDNLNQNNNNFFNLKNQDESINDYYQSFYNKYNTFLYNKNSYNNENKKNRKIKLNYLYNDKKVNKNFYNGANNVFNKYNNKTENKNYLIKNEDEDDIKYNNSIKKIIKKTYTNTNLNRKLYNHSKNHSVFIFNQ